MEKLIELLNEYVEKHNKSDLYYTFELEKDSGWLFCYDDATDHKGWTMQDEAMVIISKKFGFIEWLVEERKIAYDIPNNSDLYRAFELACISLDNADYITMLLSIQENPIEFLVSILK